MPSHTVTSTLALKNYICCFRHGCLRSLLENIASPQTILALLVVLEIPDSQSMTKANQIPEPRASFPSLSPQCDWLMPSLLWWTSASETASPNQSFLHQVVSKKAEFFIWAYQCRSRYYRTICFCLFICLLACLRQGLTRYPRLVLNTQRTHWEQPLPPQCLESLEHLNTKPQLSFDRAVICLTSPTTVHPVTVSVPRGHFLLLESLLVTRQSVLSEMKTLRVSGSISATEHAKCHLSMK